MIPTSASSAFRDTFLADADGLLRRAAEKVEGEPEVYQQRVAFVRAGLEYTRLILDQVSVMRQLRENNDPEALSQARENWERIQQIMAEHPTAMNEWAVRRAMGRRVNLLPEQD